MPISIDFSVFKFNGLLAFRYNLINFSRTCFKQVSISGCKTGQPLAFWLHSAICTSLNALISIIRDHDPVSQSDWGAVQCSGIYDEQGLFHDGTNPLEHSPDKWTQDLLVLGKDVRERCGSVKRFLIEVDRPVLYLCFLYCCCNLIDNFFLL